MNLVVTKFKDILSLIKGLIVTGKFFFAPRVTIRYPRQTIDSKILRSFRGPLELVAKDDDPTISRCISCMMCVNACPSKCISISKFKDPELSPEEEKALAEAQERGEKVKRPSAPKNPKSYTYDFTLCSLCACCVESCPSGAIRFSNNIYVCGVDREEFKYELVASLAQGKHISAININEETE